jgi:hypothetical protein
MYVSLILHPLLHTLCSDLLWSVASARRCQERTRRGSARAALSWGLGGRPH